MKLIIIGISVIMMAISCQNSTQESKPSDQNQETPISDTLRYDDEKHLSNFGIDPEQASHTLIKSLSGGQKVKIVLAASLWQHPHLIILDEPTNYLDRDGLGALTQAIHDFKGGVVIISHNKEFTSAIVQEKWIMEKGMLRREGESVEAITEHTNSITEKNEIVYDSYGNEIKVEKQVVRNARELKKEIKTLQKQLKDAKKSGNMSLIDAIDIQIEKLQEDVSKF